MAKRTVNWGRTPWTIAFRAKARRLPDKVDVAIIGGGFTGLTAAAVFKHLAPQKSVLLLEAERVGNGASGRTGGLVLAETAAGKLPGLGDVLKGYRRILRQLGVKADLELPGVWELARGTKSMEGKTVRAQEDSPIEWNDLGKLRAVEKVPGGAVDPGKVVTGLARAATRAGAQIAEHSAVEKIDFRKPLCLHIHCRSRGGVIKRAIFAHRVLIATNAGSLELGDAIFAGREPAEPKLTFAVATAPLSRKALAEMGFASRQPCYTVDLPYLWGRLRKNAIIFGSGLVPGWGESMRPGSGRTKSVKFDPAKLWSGLEGLDTHKDDAAARLKSLERRIRGLHPVLEKIRVTHRWGGPILLTKDFVPVFQRHPKSANVVVAGGYSGHGVALSVYLGEWAAQHLLGRRPLPQWRS
jgi:glycine/D-amino acid oxidase-like deaminating enzyme